MLALTLTAAACSGSGRDDDLTDVSLVEPVPQTTTIAPGTTTTVPATTTTTEAPTEELAMCTPDMGSTMLLGAEAPRRLRPPPDFEFPDGDESFDWDQDGTPDRLVIGEPEGTLRLEWGTGSLTITGINTTFDLVHDENGVPFTLRQPYQDQVRPAAVGDVTGDGWLDLVVQHEGTVAVLAGVGDQTQTGTLDFHEVGSSTPGWRSPPLRRETQHDWKIEPWPNSTVEQRWDITGNGASDFLLHGPLERSQGLSVYYEGIPCRTR